MNLRCGLAATLVTFLCCVPSESLAEEQPTAIGRRVENFTLDNCYGKSVSLSDFDDKRALVIVFLGTECPLAKLYGVRLSELQSDFAEDDVMILGINSNTQDSLTELAGYRSRYDINFPLLKDVGNRVADAMGATRTPEVFLLDADRVVRYHGRIDDQYGVGYSRERTVRPDLGEAIKQLIAGEPIENPETEVTGCHIGRVQAMEPTGNITYTEHIAAIFNARCVTCHREREIGPFTLQSYDDIIGWEDTILEVIEDRRMPPWFANPNHGSFANDARLTAEEEELIQTWIDNGMPEGDPALLPEPPKFTAGWRIPEPDAVIEMSDTDFQVPAEGTVDYKRFLIDPEWEEDKFIHAAEARPDNREVVHHILVYVIEPGMRRTDLEKTLVGYAPGSLPIQLDEGVAIRVPKGSKLLFEMHYTPNGYATKDRSYVGVCFADKAEVKKILRSGIAANGRFKIPAGDPNHEVEAYYQSKRDEYLISMTPHMHLRGKAFRYEARFPDGTEEILLEVPNYDFNWQLKYTLAEPKLLPSGTVIKCLAVYDNSEDNLSNPDPNVDVRWGDQSWEEMMIGFMSILPVDADL